MEANQTWQEPMDVHESSNNSEKKDGNKTPPPPGEEFEESTAGKRRKKPKRGNMTHEEETELKKNISLGSILSGLAAGNIGNKARENPVESSSRNRDNYRNSSNNDYNYDNNGSNNYDNYNQYNQGNLGNNPNMFNSWNVGRNWNDSWNDSAPWGGNGHWNQNNQWNTQEQWNQGEVNNEEQKDDWIDSENKLLAEEFGPGIVTLSPNENDQGGMVYQCEICQTSLNGRKSLDNHVDGMRHLKRKNLHDKKMQPDSSAQLLTPEQLFNKINTDKDKDGPTEKKPSSAEKKSSSAQSNAPSQQNFNQPSRPPHTRPESGMYGPPPPFVQNTGLSTVTPVVPQSFANSQWIPAAANYNTLPTQQENPPHTNYYKKPAKEKSSPQKSTDVSIPDPPKPKGNLAGGAVGNLLKKLAACAVKSPKDSDLATNVVISLVKCMKEYNHDKGDTKAIETLTEMGIKLRGLKTRMAALSAETKEKTETSKPVEQKSWQSQIKETNKSNRPPPEYSNKISQVMPQPRGSNQPGSGPRDNPASNNYTSPYDHYYQGSTPYGQPTQSAPGYGIAPMPVANTAILHSGAFPPPPPPAAVPDKSVGYQATYTGYY